MIICLLVLLAILQIADVYTTYVVIKNGGVELNKPLAFLMSKIGVIPSLLLTKVLYAVVLYLIIPLISPTACVVLLTLTIVLYVAVLTNNVKVVKEMRLV